MFDDWNACFVADTLDQALATAWHNHINIGFHGNQFTHCGTVCGFHHQHGRLWQTSLLQTLMHQLGQCLIAVYGFGTTTQDTGVAGFDA